MRRAWAPVAALVCAASFSYGCASAPETPQQRLYAIQAAYTEAVQQMAAYEARPRCGAPLSDPMACSDPGVVQSMRTADDAAALALTAARQSPTDVNVDALEADLRALKTILLQATTR